MAYQRDRRTVLAEINKGNGFKVNLPEKLSDTFSIAYLTLENARDPVESNKVTLLNKGHAALYIITKGAITIRLHENDIWMTEVLETDESIYVTEGTFFEISGTGNITLINFPAHSEQTYSHPNKP